MKQLIEALTILLKYAPEGAFDRDLWGMTADGLFVHVPVEVTDTDLARLQLLGWYWDRHLGAWRTLA